jgi:hypothetical protein
MRAWISKSWATPAARSCDLGLAEDRNGADVWHEDSAVDRDRLRRGEFGEAGVGRLLQCGRRQQELDKVAAVDVVLGGGIAGSARAEALLGHQFADALVLVAAARGERAEDHRDERADETGETAQGWIQRGGLRSADDGMLGDPPDTAKRRPSFPVPSAVGVAQRDATTRDGVAAGRRMGPARYESRLRL